jgi:hypothetical protein
MPRVKSKPSRYALYSDQQLMVRAQCLNDSIENGSYSSSDVLLLEDALMELSVRCYDREDMTVYQFTKREE